MNKIIAPLVVIASLGLVSHYSGEEVTLGGNIPKKEVSYIEVPVFTNGDLGVNEYAITEGGYVALNKDKELQGFSGTPRKGMVEVSIVGSKKQVKYDDRTRKDLTEQEYSNKIRRQ